MNAPNESTQRNLFLQTIRNLMQEEQMATSPERWLLAVSGGADSMAMLHALHKLSKECPCIEAIHVVHFNHQLRGAESDADAEFVVEQAQALGLVVTVESLDVRSFSEKTGESIETAARQLRYQALERIAEVNRCGKVALAHHADDQAETILHRILRGTGIRGLAGMSTVRELAGSVKIVRPLLACRRSQIEAFLNQGGFVYRTDRSNHSTDFTRNKIRLELLPQLQEQYNPNLCDALVRLGQMAQWNQSHLTDQAQTIFTQIVIEQTKDTIILDAKEMQSLPPILQTELVAEALKALGVPLRSMGYKQIVRIVDLVNDTNRQDPACFPGGLQVRCDDERLVFEVIHLATSIALRPNHITPLTLPGRTYLEGFVIETEEGFCAIKSVESKRCERKTLSGRSVTQDKSGLWEMVDADQVVGELYLRSRRDSDRFVPLGAPGEKKLGDFFTDHKVPLSQRDAISLLCDDLGIVWVMGMRIADRVKQTVHTKNILHVIAQS